MFSRTRDLYDAVYSWKDYPREARVLRQVIAREGISEGASFLDVACGTGAHIPHLRFAYAIEGMDLDPGMLEIAREKNPGIVFHQADMTDFDLGKKFDVVACLFSSIAYTRTRSRLAQAIGTMAKHLMPSGVMFIEPFVPPERWAGYTPNGQYVDQPRMKLCRMVYSERTGNEVAMTFHYVVSRPEGVEYLTETHEIGLFDAADYQAAFAAAGLIARHDGEGLMGRGAYIARFAS
ncbi:MAG TPA: class I SAM-dependent methyltransferase [Alphaproteobacteria bacterium]|nr:class I SAM-dependent methyltransferase [Alphaproteobacteria bacterium]